MVEILKIFGIKCVMVVYGVGIDEIVLYGIIKVVELNNGELSEYMLIVSDFGFVNYLFE